jgi:hypothetical protein
MVADVARIAPIMVSGVGKVPLTLTRLNRYGDNKAGGFTGTSRPADARERADKKRAAKGGSKVNREASNRVGRSHSTSRQTG